MTDSTLRTSPLHAVHEQAGATFTDFGGWQMPLKYTSELAEHRAVRESAGLFDLSHMGEVRVSGKEAAAALDYALVGKLSSVKPGRAKYSLVCTEAGTILDDVITYRMDSPTSDSAGGADGGEPGPGTEFLVVPNAGNAPAVDAALTERAARFDAHVSDESAATALVAVQGPQSARILAAALASGAEGLEELKYYAWLPAAVQTDAGQVPVLVARTGYTGEDGFELFIGPQPDGAPSLSDAATGVWQALVSAAEQIGADLLPCGLASRDSLRLEAGMPLYGNELDLDHTPAESGVGPVVALSKEGDFVGRAALEQKRDDADAGGAGEGAQVLVGLQGAGRRAARSGYPVLDGEGTAVGQVTSGAPSPTLGYPIALARVDARLNEPGTELQVDLRGRPETFTVVKLPFYRRQR